jgi:hypothetical protein
VAKVTKAREKAARPGRFASAAEFRRVLDEALTELDSDELSGPRFQASGMRVRFDLPDIAAAFELAAAEAGAHYLRWTFGAEDWAPRLRFRMDSDVANRFLQGRESLAIGVARGRVKVSGEPLCTLLYIPALKLLVEPYRHAIRQLLPKLALD